MSIEQPEAKNIQIIPSEEDARHIVEESLNVATVSTERFPTGLANYVYDVKTEEGKDLVVRMSRPENRDKIEAAVYWSNLLKPKGVPLPEVFDAKADAIIPFIIMERLPGTDLGDVYKQLTREQKKSLAHEMAQIQEHVATLPEASGFGFAKGYDDTFKETWADVVNASFERNRKHIEASGVANPEAVDELEKKLPDFETYFSQIRPKAFLDDITTKNVIINNGKLSGIVDVDTVAFGDSLYTVALTHMSLLSSKDDLDYIDYWTEEIGITDQQRKVLDFYTALFCTDFMGEVGQKFNKDAPAAVDTNRIVELETIFKDLMSRL